MALYIATRRFKARHSMTDTSVMSATTFNSSTLSRRRLLQLVAAGGGALAYTCAGGGVAYAAQAGAVPSPWSDPRSWGGQVPGPGDVATIASSIILDTDAEVAGVVIEAGGSLSFDPGRTITLSSRGNVEVRGTLQMRPSAAVRHRLILIDVDESRFVGSGMSVLPTDVGVWVMDQGRLDVVGTAKTPWARLAGDATRGSTVLQLDRAVAGWAVGDRVVVTPTAPFAVSRALVSWAAFSEATVTSVSGSRVTLDTPLAYDHPRVGGQWTAEVVNLTRSVEIAGTQTGRSHVFVHSSEPQALSYATIQHCGPRHPDGTKIEGRWPLHFHHCDDGTRGTVLQGVVVVDAGSHAFVPHVSHGITFRDCIAYRSREHAFWWDDGHGTNDIVWESCVAAGLRSDEFRLAGFYLSKGAGNVIRDCVAVGNEGSDGGGITSPGRISEGSWVIEDCLSHNNKHAGFKAYLNSNRYDEKVVSRLSAYHNRVGIDHGAYSNAWVYDTFTLYANENAGISLKAVAKDSGIIFRNGTIDQAGRGRFGAVNDRHFASPLATTSFRSCQFRGHTVAGLGLVVPNRQAPDLIDLVDCSFEGNELWMASDTYPDSVVRFQDSSHGTIAARPSSQAGTLVPAWNARTLPIDPFA